MIYVNGVYLPDGERDKVMLGAGASYQATKFASVLSWTTKRRVAVDIGAHCGLWSMQFARAHFASIVAFEPLQQHVECYRKNVPEGRYVLHQVALGEEHGTCGMKIVESLSGRSHVAGEGDVPMMRLDDFGLCPDLIKIDAEGYEYFILKGGEETLKTYRPAIIVEQKPQYVHGRYGLPDTAATDYLFSLGAKQRDLIAGDWVFSWDKE